MKLRNDRRGFVLSGAALLLVLPAMLLAASYLGIIGTGGEAASLQVTSDKVTNTGHDIERIITYMQDNRMSFDNSTLNSLQENYRASTGLIVDITYTGAPETVTLAKEQLSDGEGFELETTLFGFELEVEAENKGAVIEVDDFEFGDTENEDVQGTDFTLSIQQSNITVDVIVQEGWIEVRYTVGAGQIAGVLIKVKDPRSAVQYLSTVSTG